MREELLNKRYPRHISARRNLLLIIISFISAYKNMLIPRHHITSLYMYLFGGSNHLIWVHLFYYVFNCLKFSLSIRQDIRFDKHIINHEANIASKDLIAISDNFRTIDLHAILLQYRCESVHLGYHILFYRVSTRLDMLSRFRVVSLL